MTNISQLNENVSQLNENVSQLNENDNQLNENDNQLNENELDENELDENELDDENDDFFIDDEPALFIPFQYTTFTDENVDMYLNELIKIIMADHVDEDEYLSELYDRLDEEFCERNPHLNNNNHDEYSFYEYLNTVINEERECMIIYSNKYLEMKPLINFFKRDNEIYFYDYLVERIIVTFYQRYNVNLRSYIFVIHTYLNIMFNTPVYDKNYNKIISNKVISEFNELFELTIIDFDKTLEKLDNIINNFKDIYVNKIKSKSISSLFEDIEFYEKIYYLNINKNLLKYNEHSAKLYCKIVDIKKFHDNVLSSYTENVEENMLEDNFNKYLSILSNNNMSQIEIDDNLYFIFNIFNYCNEEKRNSYSKNLPMANWTNNKYYYENLKKVEYNTNSMFLSLINPVHHSKIYDVDDVDDVLNNQNNCLTNVSEEVHPFKGLLNKFNILEAIIETNSHSFTSNVLYNTIYEMVHLFKENYYD